MFPVVISCQGLWRQCNVYYIDIIQHRSVISEWVILTEECSTHGFDKQFPVLCVAVGPVICVVLKLPILRKYKWTELCKVNVIYTTHSQCIVFFFFFSAVLVIASSFVSHLKYYVSCLVHIHTIFYTCISRCMKMRIAENVINSLYFQSTIWIN